MSRQYRAIVVLIALAAIAFLTYRHYHHPLRNSLPGGAGGPVTILVAKRAIPKGTPANTIAAKELYVAKTIRPSRNVLSQGITDASALRGLVTVKRIPAGQQLTAADFGHATG